MPRDQLFDQPDFLPQFDDLRPLAPARIAVTGHRGVLGRIFARRCASAGIEAMLFEGDVTDAAAVDAWVAESAPTLIYHFAAKVPVTEVARDPLRAYEVNALGAFHVAASTIRHAPTAWLFMASSSHVYAPLPPAVVMPLHEDSGLEPATFYGASKLAAERLVLPVVRQCQIACCFGRIFSFSHATQRPPYLVPSLRTRIADLSEGATLRLATPTAVRDILDAESVVDAVVALTYRRHVGIVNIGAGRGLTVEGIARMLAKRLGKRIDIEPDGDAPPNALVADVARLRSVLQSGRFPT